jgi:hypothetical protein
MIIIMITIIITKYENLALEIKMFWKLNNIPVYPIVISAEGVETRSFLNAYGI